jgi:SAM-dependent methyltransferase
MNWVRTQDRLKDDFKRGENMLGHVDDKVVKFSEMITYYLGGKTCLDVGCGILPLPPYMALCPTVKFTGVDPFDGQTREFPFVMAKAESLPFNDSTFNGACFAGSLNHMDDPEQAISEVRRVIKDFVVIYGVVVADNDPVFKEWQQTRDYNIYQLPWMFSLETLRELMKGFIQLREIRFNNQLITVWQSV